MNEQKKKGQNKSWAKFGTKSAKSVQKGAAAESGKSEASHKLPATPPRATKGRPQKKKKINKSEIGKEDLFPNPRSHF
jgi:hypothetical protein